MKPNKPNIVRVERDGKAMFGGNRHFYYVMFDRPTDDDFVIVRKDRSYTHILADDELDAWHKIQKTLDITYGKD
jgi:hypothetical protein